MQKNNNKFQSTIVWSNRPDVVDTVSSSDFPKKYVLEILNEKIQQHLGRVTYINSIQKFPLYAHINEKFYDD